MKKRYTHIVVDMQPNFQGCETDWLLSNNRRELHRAMERKCPVIFTMIPYWSWQDEEGFPDPHERLLKVVKGYRVHDKKFYRIVEKMAFTRSITSSARQIIQAGCERKRPHFPTDRFRISGLYSGGYVIKADGTFKLDRAGEKIEALGCVFDMVSGLTLLLPSARIEVIQDACITFPDCVDNWNLFTSLPNVTLV